MKLQYLYNNSSPLRIIVMRVAKPVLYLCFCQTEEVSAHKQSFELLQKELAGLKEKQADRQFMSKVRQY